MTDLLPGLYWTMAGAAAASAGIALAISPSAAEIAAMRRRREEEEWARIAQAEREQLATVLAWGHEVMAAQRTAPRWERRPPSADSAVPPMNLFHGTSAENLVPIARSGLEGRTRGQAWMAQNVETARGYGVRNRDYVIVRIRANQAYQAGVAFESRGGGVFTTEEVASEFLDLEWTLLEWSHRNSGTRHN